MKTLGYIYQSHVRPGIPGKEHWAPTQLLMSYLWQALPLFGVVLEALSLPPALTAET